MVGEASPINAGEGTNVLQSFSDATAGRSIQLYYGMGAKTTAGAVYILGRDSGVSSPKTITYTTTGDLDFDITINKPTIFQGIGTLDLNYGIAGGSGNQLTMTIIVTVYHYDGVTETSLGTVTVDTATNATSDEVEKLMFNISKQLFGVGHTLRLNFAVTLSHNDDARYGFINFDPQTAGDEMKLWMPVKNLE